MKKKVRAKYTVQLYVNKTFHTTEKLPFKTRIVRYPAKTALTLPGDIEKKLYFVRSGMLQASIIGLDKKENIVSFALANQFQNSLSSFITQQPTEYKIECVTDCVLEIIERDDLFNAMKHSELANQLYKLYLEWAYLYRLKKQRDLLTKDALTRYNELIKEEPEIMKLIPVVKIAGFLGIHPRSLSRLRKL